MIPKIIHQMAPANPNKWNYFWHECHKSWKDTHPDFEHMMWTDEKVFELVEQCYPQHYDLFMKFEHDIIRWDFARFCVLHKFGGIYADMDFFCYKRFYDKLKKNIYVVESWREWGEVIQNSLMMSTPGHAFWTKCMNECKIVSHSNINLAIKETCGPQFISQFASEVTVLRKEQFNPKCKIQMNFDLELNSRMLYFNKINSNETDCYTRHWLTSDWFEKYSHHQ